MTNRAITACFTGHRYIPDIDILVKNRIKKEIEKLIEKGVIYFGNGGALGFDTLVAQMVLDLKEKHPQIKLIMVLPCKEQDKFWSAKDKKIYAYILDRADKKVYVSENYYDGCMLVRNRYLVDNSGYCIAYLRKDKGGTAFTVNYALENELEVINIAER